MSKQRNRKKYPVPPPHFWVDVRISRRLGHPLVTVPRGFYIQEHLYTQGVPEWFAGRLGLIQLLPSGMAHRVAGVGYRAGDHFGGYLFPDCTRAEFNELICMKGRRVYRRWS